MADERGEAASHFDFYGSAGRRGQDDDGGNQLAQRLDRLAIVAQAFRRQGLLKILDLLPIPGKSSRVERYGLGRVFGTGELGLKLLALRPQFSEWLTNLCFFGKSFYV